MIRLAVIATALLATTAVLAQVTPEQALAPTDETVTATQIHSFRDLAVGSRVGSLVWRGGLVLESETDTFGGLSSLDFVGDDGRLVFVSDRGNFVSGQLIHDEAGLPFGLVGVKIEPIQNSRGAELPLAYTRDAEALSIIHRNGRPAAVRVGFENLTRVADFDLEDGIPTGPAREIAVPQWLADLRTNESLESLCIAPAASPIAGSTLLMTEAAKDEEGNHQGWLLGRLDKGPISLAASSGTNPTDCAFLPNGDLLVLERGIAFLSFAMKLRMIPADQVRPGAVMTGRVLLEATGGDIDNMEGVAVYTGAGGETRIAITSDNNFNDWQRTLLLEFSLN